MAEFDVVIKGNLTHADGTAETVTIEGQALITRAGGGAPIVEGDEVKIVGGVKIDGGMHDGAVQGKISKDEPEKGPKTK
jgi:hypothetical protein